MTILIHGDNELQSYNHLQDLKSQFAGEVTSLDLKSLTPVSLLERLSGASLFPHDSLFVFENLSGGKKILADLSFPKDINIILYSSDKLQSGDVILLQKKLPGLKNEEFKLDPVVFKFLDSIKPKNQKVMIPLWQAYSSKEVPEIAFTMIIRQFRLLIITKDKFLDLPDDLKNLSPWQKTNLTKQASLFTEKELLDIYAKLEDLDYQFKTGQTPLSLTDSLELFLYSL